jgi:hypothetical protein
MRHNEAWVYHVLIPSVITLALIFILINYKDNYRPERQPASVVSQSAK